MKLISQLIALVVATTAAGQTELKKLTSALARYVLTYFRTQLATHQK
jgi:hypothetical protein